MDLQDRVFEALAEGESPSEIMHKLSLRRDKYYGILDSLERDLGVLSRIGDLPPGAVTELCPPAEATDLFRGLGVDTDNVGWSVSTLGKLKSLCARYGWLEPPSPDSRYNRSRWTGQAVRRVDFSHGENSYMVCGFLVPRVDKKTWQRATPKFRVIHVSRNGEQAQSAWVAERGQVVNIRTVNYLGPVKHNGELSALAVAIAWVLESRALLANSITRDETANQ